MFLTSLKSLFPFVAALVASVMATPRPQVEPFLPLTSTTTASTVFSTATRSLTTTLTPSQRPTVRPDAIITYSDTTLTIDGSRLRPTLEPYDIGTCFGLPPLSTEAVEETETVQVTLTQDVVTRSLTTTAAEETKAEATSLPPPSRFLIITSGSSSDEFSTTTTNLLTSITTTAFSETSTSDDNGTAPTTIPIAESNGRRAYESGEPWNGTVFLLVLVGMEMVFVGGGLMGVLNWLLICSVFSAIIMGVEARQNVQHLHGRRQLVANPDHFPLGENMRVPDAGTEAAASIRTVQPTYECNFADVNVVPPGMMQPLNVTVLNIETTSEQKTATVAFTPAAFTLTLTGPLPTTLLISLPPTNSSLSSGLQSGITSSSTTEASITSLSPTTMDDPDISPTVSPPLVGGLPKKGPGNYPYPYPDDAAKSSSAGCSIELPDDKTVNWFFTSYFLLIGLYISATLRSPARLFLTVALIWICQVVFLGVVAEDGSEGGYSVYGDWTNLRSSGEVKAPPNKPIEPTTTISSTLTLPIYVVVPDTETMDDGRETLAETVHSQRWRTQTVLITDTERGGRVTFTVTEWVAPVPLETTRPKSATSTASMGAMASTDIPIPITTTEVTESEVPPASKLTTSAAAFTTTTTTGTSPSPTSSSSTTSLPDTYPYPYPDDSLTSSAEGVLEPKLWIANAWVIMFFFIGLNVALTSPSALRFIASMALLTLVVSLMVGITLGGLDRGGREF